MKDSETSLIKPTFPHSAQEAKNIRFEGNNYAPEWLKEAKRRSLPNIASTYESLEALIDKKNIALFEKYKVFSKEEIVARYHIWVHTYNTTIEIEAQTLNEMVNASVVPAGYEYQKLLSGNLDKLVSLAKTGAVKLDAKALDDQKKHLAEIAQKIFYVRRNLHEMTDMLDRAQKLHHEERAKLYFEELKPLMEHIRKHADALECVVSDEHWDLPKYREMLFIK